MRFAPLPPPPPAAFNALRLAPARPQSLPGAGKRGWGSAAPRLRGGGAGAGCPACAAAAVAWSRRWSLPLAPQVGAAAARAGGRAAVRTCSEGQGGRRRRSGPSPPRSPRRRLGLPPPASPGLPVGNPRPFPLPPHTRRRGERAGLHRRRVLGRATLRGSVRPPRAAVGWGCTTARNRLLAPSGQRFPRCLLLPFLQLRS